MDISFLYNSNRSYRNLFLTRKLTLYKVTEISNTLSFFSSQFAKDELKETTSKSTKIQSLGDLKGSPRAHGGDVRCNIFVGRREKTGNLFFF